MDESRYIAKEFFVYTASLSSLASNASNADQVQLEADSDFLINKLTFAVYDAADGALVAAPNLTVQITDSASGRTLFDEAQPIVSIAGTGELPFVPPVAKLIRAKSTMTVTFANRSSATLYNIALTFAGTKLYLRG